MVRAMRRIARALHHIQRLRFPLLAFLLTCVVASAYAGVRVNASGIRSTGATATGVRTTATLEATFTGTVGGVKTYGVPVPVSSSTLGSLAKSALKRGAGAYGWYTVAKALIDGAGWAINELQQQVVVPGVDREPLTGVVYCTPQSVCTSTQASYLALFEGKNNGLGTLSACGFKSPTGPVLCTLMANNGWQVIKDFNVGLNIRPVEPTDTNGNPGSDPVPVSDYDLGQLLKQSPQVINAILVDPETGAPIRTQELVDAMNALRRQLEAANGLDPGIDLAPTDDATKTEPRESQWPEFCNWATVVCDFIEWVKTDEQPGEKPEVPWEEENPADVSQSWSSGLGGGSCPAPATFTVSLAGQSATPEFSFEPICQFGTTMRPVIIALATIIAGLIIAGVRGTKDA